MLLFSLWVCLAATINRKLNRKINHRPETTSFQHIIKQVASSPHGVAYVDLENVRGKSGFVLTHQDLLHKTCQWMNYHRLSGQVVMVADHGSVPEARLYSDPSGTGSLPVLFAGPSQKADDVLARASKQEWRTASTMTPAVVITADALLQSRCRKSSPDTTDFHSLNPCDFIDDLQRVEDLLQLQNISMHSTAAIQQQNASISIEQLLLMRQLEEQINLRGQLHDAQAQIDKRRNGITNKRRKKLKTKISAIRSKLTMMGPSLLDQLTSTNANFQNIQEPTLTPSQQQLLLDKWQSIRRQSSRREKTGDRIILAEQLRRDLLDRLHLQTNPKLEQSEEAPALSISTWYNRLYTMPSSIPTPVPSTHKSNEESNAPIASKLVVASTKSLLERAIETNIDLDPFTIVAISDTHGLEAQLPSTLPKGDLLLHLGDFASDGSTEGQQHSLKHLDAWLAKQPHKYKVIIRGNHDPWDVDFTLSGSYYVRDPTTIQIGKEIVLSLVPFGSARKLAAAGGIPENCTVLATHVPPFRILDRSYTGQAAGSPFLRRAVESMQRPPLLWLCGHIHEGRGLEKRSFQSARHQSSTETTVINAANANCGRATYLEHGPVTVQLNATSEQSPESSRCIESIEMANLTYCGIDLGGSKSFSTIETISITEETDSSTEPLVLAVDLGLKSGVALYSSQGKLLRYQQFLFQNERLQEAFSHLLEEWEIWANEESYSDGTVNRPPKRTIRYIAIEGGDPSMLEKWAEAASDETKLLQVSPHEWRSNLLTSKEQFSGKDAKAASRLIARQVVKDFGIMENHQENLLLSDTPMGELWYLDPEPKKNCETNCICLLRCQMCGLGWGRCYQENSQSVRYKVI